MREKKLLASNDVDRDSASANEPKQLDAVEHLVAWRVLSIATGLAAFLFGLGLMMSSGMVLGGTEYLEQLGTKGDRVYIFLLSAATSLFYTIAAASRYKTGADPRLQVGSFTAAGFASLIGAVACSLTLVVFIARYFPGLLIPLLVAVLLFAILTLLVLEGWAREDSRALKDAVVTGISLISLFAALNIAMLQVASDGGAGTVGELLSIQLKTLGLGR